MELPQKDQDRITQLLLGHFSRQELLGLHPEANKILNRPSIVAVLAALPRFAQIYDQEQIHVRTPTSRPIGHEFGDGSYSTFVYTIPVNRQMSGGEVLTCWPKVGFPA
jgi:hypothetical protein